MRFHGRCSSKQMAGFACVGLVLVMGTNSMAHDDQKQRHSPTLVPVWSAQFSFDGERLLTVPGYDKVAYLWDVETGKELQRFKGHAETVRAVTFSPDGKCVLTGAGREVAMTDPSRDNSARLWDLATGKEVRRFEGHEGFVHTVQFSPDGRRILTAGRDSTARVWDVGTGKELFCFSSVRNFTPSPAAAFSPNGGAILGLVAGGHRLVLCNAKTWQENCRIEIERGKGFFNSAEFSPDGEVVLTASSDGTARTWNAKTGRQAHVFTGHTSYVRHAAFGADGQTMITASHDGTVRLWDANTGGEIRRFKNPGAVWKVLLSGDGKRFFAKWSGPDRSGVSLWNAESGQEVKQLPDESSAEIVSFSPDSKKFLTVSYGKCATLCDAETGEVIREYD